MTGLEPLRVPSVAASVGDSALYSVTDAVPMPAAKVTFAGYRARFPTPRSSGPENVIVLTPV